MEYIQKFIWFKVSFFLDGALMLFSIFDSFGGARSKETLTIMTILMIFTLRVISWIEQNKIQSMEHQKKLAELEEANEKLKIAKKERELLDKILSQKDDETKD